VILAYNQTELIEPKLEIPGEKPIGPVSLKQGNVIGENLYSWWPFTTTIPVSGVPNDGYQEQSIAGRDFKSRINMHGFLFSRADLPEILMRKGQQAAFFDGGSRLYNTQKKEPLTTDITFAVLIEFTSITGDQAIIGRYSTIVDPHTKYGQGLLIANGILYGFRSNGSAKHVSTAPPAIGKKAMIVFTTHGTTGYLYIDGVLKDSGAVNSSVYNGYNFAMGVPGGEVTSPNDLLYAYVYGAWVLDTYLPRRAVYNWSKDPYYYLNPAS